MKTCQRRASLALLLLALLTLPAVSQQSKPRKVGRVLDIAGTRLMTNKLKEKGWFQAYPQMPTYLHEKLKTDAQTTSTLEFTIGGQAVITPGSQVEVVGQRGVKSGDNAVLLSAGKMWAKFDKQNSQLQIKTSAGVMGIEGTELVVEVLDAQTRMSLLEGQVLVTSASGKKQRLRSGQRARFGGKVGLLVESLEPDVLEALQEKDLVEARRRLLNKLEFPAPARKAIAAAAGRQELVAGAFPSRPMSPKNLTTPLPRPDDVPPPVGNLQAGGSPLTFSWDTVPGPTQYTVRLSIPGQDEPLWIATTADNSLVYPEYAPDLVAGGTYSWSVTPLTEDGSLYVISYFDFANSSTLVAGGHTSRQRLLDSPQVEAGQGPPSLSWSATPYAASYQVVLADDPEFSDWLWADRTDQLTYRYPDSARALPPGRYQLKVQAYDQLGRLIGSSPAVAFTTAGWSAPGITP